MDISKQTVSKIALAVSSSAALLLSSNIAQSGEKGDITAQCITHETFIKEIHLEAAKDTDNSPEFRITKADDGQSLIYWHFGGETGSFHAVSFNSKGCAILGTSGSPRNFIFPKTAYNTGVFFEMEIVKTEF